MGHLAITWDIGVLGEAPCVWLDVGRMTDYESRDAFTDCIGLDRASQCEDPGLKIGEPTF